MRVVSTIWLDSRAVGVESSARRTRSSVRETGEVHPNENESPRTRCGPKRVRLASAQERGQIRYGRSAAELLVLVGTTAYVCENRVCQFPTNDAVKFLELLLAFPTESQADASD